MGTQLHGYNYRYFAIYISCSKLLVHFFSPNKYTAGDAIYFGNLLSNIYSSLHLEKEIPLLSGRFSQFTYLLLESAVT